MTLLKVLPLVLLTGCASTLPVVQPVVKPEVPPKPVYMTTTVQGCKTLPEAEQLVCAFRLATASLEQCDNYTQQLKELLK